MGADDNPERRMQSAEGRIETDGKLTVLVTGGGGFIGKALIHRLVARGYGVRSLTRSRYPELDALGVTTIQGDLADLEITKRACADCDAIFHVAAKAGVWGPYEDYHRANVIGTENCLAASQGRTRYFVYTSSPSVVFDGHHMAGADESAPYPTHHRSNYSKSKAIAEQKVLAANREDFRTIALRPHLVWGPGDNHIVPRIITQARAGKLRIIGSGENKVDTTYIDNAADAHINALDALRKPNPTRDDRSTNPSRDCQGAGKNRPATNSRPPTDNHNAAQTPPPPGEARWGHSEKIATNPDCPPNANTSQNPAGKPYFITNGEPIAIRDIINGILQAANEPPITRHVPPAIALTAAAMMEFTHRLLRRKTEPRLTRFVVEELSATHHFNITAARRDLGYNPKITIAEGLNRLRNHMMETHEQGPQ